MAGLTWAVNAKVGVLKVLGGGVHAHTELNVQVKKVQPEQQWDLLEFLWLRRRRPGPKEGRRRQKATRWGDKEFKEQGGGGGGGREGGGNGNN